MAEDPGQTTPVPRPPRPGRGWGCAQAGDSPGAAQHCTWAGTLRAVLPHTQIHTSTRALAWDIIPATPGSELGGVAHASSIRCFLMRDPRAPARGLCWSPQPVGSTSTGLFSLFWLLRLWSLSLVLWTVGVSDRFGLNKKTLANLRLDPRTLKASVCHRVPLAASPTGVPTHGPLGPGAAGRVGPPAQDGTSSKPTLPSAVPAPGGFPGSLCCQCPGLMVPGVAESQEGQEEGWVSVQATAGVSRAQNQREEGCTFPNPGPPPHPFSRPDPSSTRPGHCRRGTRVPRASRLIWVPGHAPLSFLGPSPDPPQRP